MLRRLTFALALLLFTACGPSGCPADPGAGCTPGRDVCRGSDYYCSVGGICTKVCSTDLDCNPSCETAEECGVSSDDGSAPAWTCSAGSCLCVAEMCPEVVTCIEGHCQRACALDQSCVLDPYAPRS